MEDLLIRSNKNKTKEKKKHIQEKTKKTLNITNRKKTEIRMNFQNRSS